MVAPTRRLALAVSARPAAYWLVVVALAIITALSVPSRSQSAVAAAASNGGVAPSDLSANHRGVAVPLGEPALPVHNGDHVDIVGVASDVTVLSITETAAVLAVPVESVDAVVAALRAHTTTLALVQRAASIVSTTSPAKTR